MSFHRRVSISKAGISMDYSGDGMADGVCGCGKVGNFAREVITPLND